MTVSAHGGTERKKKCVVCDCEMLEGDEICTACEFGQAARQCVNCRKRIPADAKVCAICKAYQRWWRMLSEFASAVPIIAIIALASGIYTASSYLSDRNSHTVLKVTGADQNMIYMNVWNTGRKPSALVGFRLKFDQLSATKETTLQQPLKDVTEQASNVIVPYAAPVTITLGLPRQSDLSNAQRAKQYSKDELSTLSNKELGKLAMTLEVDVEESDDDNTAQQRRDHFKADRIEEFMTRLMQ